MEAKKYLIWIFKFDLDGGKLFFYLSIFSCMGDNHKHDLFFEMGRKTKIERVLEKENIEL